MPGSEDDSPTSSCATSRPGRAAPKCDALGKRSGASARKSGRSETDNEHMHKVRPDSRTDPLR
jgi:hypothetical protein